MRDNRVGNELKTVAQDMLRLGAQCVQAGRTWLNDRRNEMAERSNDPGREQGGDRDRTRTQGGGSSQFAGDYQSRSMQQNRHGEHDDDRLWGGQGRGQQASYGASQGQRFPEGAEQAYFGRGGREDAYGGGRGQGYAAGQGYGSEGAQGYGGYGGSQRYSGDSDDSSRQFGAQQGARGQGGYGQSSGGQGYGPEREYGAQHHGGGQDYGRRNSAGYGQDRGYDPGRNHGSDRSYAGQGYGQGQHGYGQDERGRQSQGQYGQPDTYRDSYARAGLGNETIGQGRIGGYGSVSDRGGYGTDAYGGPSMGQGFGSSSGYGGSGESYGQQYGHRDDASFAGRQFGGAQQSHRGRGPKNYARSDERIVEDINERLTHADDIDASEIEVRCEGGKITLEGSVEHRWMKHRAEDIADACAGVKDVDNRISVSSSRDRSADLGSGATQQAQARNGGGKEGRESTSTGGKSGSGGTTQQH